MADNLFMQDGLSRARGMPAPRVRGPEPTQPTLPALNHADDGYLGAVSMRSGLPPNLVAAMAERARLGEDDFDQEAFETQALTLGRAGGSNLQSAVTETYGEDSKALMSRANDIADIWEGRGGGRVEDNRSIPRRVRDFAQDSILGLLHGAVSGSGVALSSSADVLDSPRLEGAAGEGFMGAVTNLVGVPMRGVASLMRGAGGALDAVGDWIHSGESDENRQKTEDFHISGHPFYPSTWDFSGITLEGALLLSAHVLGNLAPVVAATYVNPSAPWVVSGLQGYGFGKDDQRGRMEALAETGELQENSPYYRELLAAGVDEDAALERTIDAGSRTSGLWALPVSALGGHLIGKIFHGAVGNAVGGGLARRLGAGAIIGGLEEGTQEALEGMAGITGGNLTTGLSIDPMQDTLGDFIVGALAGAPIGAIGARRPRQEESEPDAPLALPPPVDAPAPTPTSGPAAAPPSPPVQAALPPPSADRQPPAAHGTIISDGPVRGGPGSNFVPYPRSEAGGLPPSDPTAQLRPQPAPAGPLSEAISTVSPRAPEATPSQLFPEMRPGAALTMALPDGSMTNATFLREDAGAVVVRAQGREVTIPAADFDAALMEVNGTPRPGARPAQTQDARTIPLAQPPSEAANAAGGIPSARPVREDVAITPSGREIPVQYALVEADDLVASNFDDGRINPDYPSDLQPRDRTRPASQQQVSRIASSLDPRLLGENSSASDGAPIVSPDGVVEGGNGRVMGLRRAYAEGGPSAQRYREHLAAQGYPVDGMRDPVLVRVRDPGMERADVVASTVEMNERTTMGMSATERAMADARSISPEMAGLYRGGDIDSADNRGFVRAFMRDVVSDADQAGMIDGEGRMSQEAVRRVQAALLARAYGDANLVAMLTESSDSNIRAIGGALTDVAGRWAQMRAEAEAGTIARAVDVTDALMEAVHVVDQARASRRNVAEYVKQTDMFSGDAVSQRGKNFLRLMFHDTEQWTRPTSRAKLGNALGFYVDEAMKTREGSDLLGGSADPDAIARVARSRIDADEPQGQGDLLARGRAVAGVPEDGGRRERPEPETAVSDERAPGTQASDGTAPGRASGPVAPGEGQAPAPTDAERRTSAPEPDLASGIAERVRERQAEINSIPADLRPIWEDAQGVPGTIRGVNDSKGARSTFARGVLDALTGKPARKAAGPARQSIYDKGRAWAEARMGAQEATPAQKEAPAPVATADRPPTAVEMDAAAAETDPSPTPAQAEAENYKTGKIKWNGLTLSIENAKDSIRRKVGPSGVEWEVTMPAHYGRTLRTEGADGDHVDFYMGDNPESDVVVVIDQVDAETGRFDEHKVILGTGSVAEARKIYERGFSDGRGPDRLGALTEMTVDEFKDWIETGDQTRPVGAIKGAQAESVEETAGGTKAPSAPKRESTGAIEDFGERLEGARKHLWESHADRMKAASNLDAGAVPLSRSWPAPDYAKLVEAGVDPWRVSAIRVLRDAIPTKPSKGWKLKGWVEAMTGIRDIAAEVMSGDTERDGFEDRLGGTKLGKHMLPTMRLYEAVGHEKSLRGIALEHVNFTSIGDGIAKRVDRWEVHQAAKATAWSNWPKVLAFGATEAEAVAAFKKAYSTLDETQRRKSSAPKFLIYSHNKGEYFTVGVKVGSQYIEVRRTETSDEARRMVREDADALAKELAEIRDIPPERRVENSPRIGVDHRSGADVTPEQFSESFGFRGVQFGTWVEGGRRQADLNEAYDALMDMAGVLGLPPRALSLNGTLGLAFGARGTGGANSAHAHYEPGTTVINLTKKRGAGSLAHEWFHAVDNYFARQVEARSGVKGGPEFLSDNSTPGAHVEGSRPEIVDAFLALKSAIGRSGLPRRSKGADRTRSKPYFSKGIEMSARAFESYVISKLNDQGASNDYLANIVSEDAWNALYADGPHADVYPYPTQAEVAEISAAYDGLFEAIETREGDGGVEMYRRAASDTADDAVSPERLRAVAATVRDIIAAHGIEAQVTARAVGRLLSSSGIPVLGLYRPGQISVNAAASDAAHITRHEIIHALRSMGLFTNAEWGGLVRAAKANEALRKRVEDAYPDVSEAIRDEEMVAEYYADWAAGEEVRTRPAIVRVLERIRQAFRSIAAALRSDGQIEAASTMRRISLGEIGRRGLRSRTGADVRAPMEATPVEREMRMFAADPGSNPADAARKEKAFISGLLDLASSKMTDYMGPGGRVNVLSLVPGRPLFTELGKEMPSTLRYQKLKEKMDTDRETLLQDAGEFTNNWRRLLSRNSKGNRAMMDLMHEATLAEVDPSIPFKPVASENDAVAARNRSARISEPARARLERDQARRKDYDRLKAAFDALPKEYQKLFRDVRDRYARQADEIEQAVIDNVQKAMKVAEDRAQRIFDDEMRRIRDEGLSGDERAAAEADARKRLDVAKAGHARSRAGRIDSLRHMFESNRLEGPYFPLMRFGNYYVTARDAKGAVVSFSKFESARSQKMAAAALKRDGWNVEVGSMDESGALRRQVDPRFVADVETLLADTGVPEGVMDDVWQSYLATMPDLSLRKSRIHRKGTPGFSGDAFRAFAKQMFHGGHQLARLRHTLDMQNALEEAEREVQGARDPNRTMAVLNEMKRRHEFTMNPTGSALAQGITSLSFAWFLGVTPAAAAVNLSQTTVVGIPILAGGFSKEKGGTIGRAARELGRASTDFAKGRGTTGQSSSLTADERAAMKEAYDRGIVDKTQSHDLAGISEQGVDPTGSVLRGVLGEEGTHKWVGYRLKAMEGIAFLFHHAERFNREVTFLAAYRMARKAGSDHAAAVDKAGDLTWKAHFDYSSSARPRIIQNDAGKVLMVFRNFQINMLWRLFRDAHQVFKGADAETRREARMQLIGITSMMMLHAGISGTWGYALLVSILSMLPGAGSDDDIEDEIKAALVNTFGAQIAGIMLKGAPGHLTGMDLSQRIGLPELWFRQDDRDLEGRDAYYMRLSEIAGAPMGIVENAYRGTHMISEGNTWRGVETMMPKFLKDIMKAARYLNEGVTTQRGDRLTEATWLDAAKQVFGFAPAAISEQYERNNRQRNAQRRIEDRRRRLMGDAARDIMAGRGMSARTRQAIQEFNREIPEWAITRSSLQQSIRSRNRFTQQTVDGLRLNPRLDRRIRGAAPPAIYAQ